MKALFLIILACLCLLQACGSKTTRDDLTNAVDAYVEIGIGYLSEGNRDLARQNISRALEIDANSPVANSALAYLYETEAELALADKHYRRALKSDATFTQARNNYARFLYYQGRYKEARNHYKLVADDVGYRLRASGFIGLGLSEKALGHYDLAEAAFTRSLSLSPSNADAMIELVDLKTLQQDYIVAKQYLNRFEAVRAITPRSLTLGMQLADKLDDKSAHERYNDMFRGGNPDSRATQDPVLADLDWMIRVQK